MSTPAYKDPNTQVITVRYFTDQDPYHYTVDNRPLGDLSANIAQLTMAAEAARRANIIEGLGNATLQNALAGNVSGTSYIGLNPSVSNNSLILAPGVLLMKQAVSASDSTQVSKRASLFTNATIPVPAPATVGQEVQYLIQIQYGDFGNATNDLYSDPSNLYLQSSVINGTLKTLSTTGIAAPTGTSITPIPTAGWLPLYIVTAVNGAVQQVTTAPNGPTLINPTSSVNYLARANHTGVQDISTITGLQSALDSKVTSGAFATAVQGAKADSALQPSLLGAVNGIATLGSNGQLTPSQFPGAGTFATAAQGVLASTAVQPPALVPYRLQTNNTFTGSSQTTVFPGTISEIIPGAIMNFTWNPVTTSNGVAPANMVNYTADTTVAGMTGDSHAIGELTYMTVLGGGYMNLGFAKEYRFAVQGGSSVGQFIGIKHVLEPDVSNNGQCSSYVLEQFDDMTDSVTWISSFQRNYLDPRMTTYHAGGHIHFPVILDSDYTFSDSDSGKLFLLNSGSNVTWTIPSTVTDGFEVRCMQGIIGGTITLVSGGRTVLNNSTKTTTAYAYDEVLVIAAASSGYLLFDWKDPINVSTVLSTKTNATASLMSWALSQSFQLVSCTRDSHNVIVTGNIVWPDGSTGVFTTDIASSAFPGAIDAWHATYVGTSFSRTITQSAVTRNASGAITAQPAITIV